MGDPSSDLPIVLVVDDDPLILDILRRMMESMTPVTTQTVVFAQTYAQALTLIATREVATILTDYTLDEGDGLQLIQQVKERFPQAVTILSSGRDQQELEVGDKTVEISHYLLKPYTLNTLVQVLSAALY